MNEAVYNPCDVQVQLEKYMAMVQEKNEQYYKICGFTHSDPDHISADYGKKYARIVKNDQLSGCLLYTSPSPRDLSTSRMPSSA